MPRKPKPQRTWTTTEQAFLRQHYPERGPKWCGKQLGRSLSACDEVARRLSLQRTHYQQRPYTDDDRQFLTRHYADRGPRWCAERLHRSLSSIKNRARRQGLHYYAKRAKGRGSASPYGTVSEQPSNRRMVIKLPAAHPVRATRCPRTPWVPLQYVRFYEVTGRVLGVDCYLKFSDGDWRNCSSGNLEVRQRGAGATPEVRSQAAVRAHRTRRRNRARALGLPDHALNA